MEEDEHTATALLLQYSSTHLARRDFANGRLQALSAQRSNPDHPAPAQILAIADVLIAAGRRLRNGHQDFYAILQVQKTDSTNAAQLMAQYRKLFSLLNPTRNKFPLCDEALSFINDAWCVLSDPVSKAKYDKEAMPKSVVVVDREGGGTEEAYHVNYSGFPFPKDKKGDSFRNAVVISSDEDEPKEEQFTGIPEKRNIKTSPLNAKKISGRGVRINVVMISSDEDEPKEEQFTGIPEKRNIKTSPLNAKKISGRGVRINVVVISSDEDEPKEEQFTGIPEKRIKTSPLNAKKISGSEDEPKVEVKKEEQFTGIPKKRNFKTIPLNAKKITGRGVRITLEELAAATNASRNQRPTGDCAVSSGDEKMDGEETGSENEG